MSILAALNPLTLKTKIYMLIGVAIVFAAAVAIGWAFGSSSGYTKGFNANQGRYDKLVSETNTKIGEKNDKISELEQLADSLRTENTGKKEEVKQAANKAVDDYKKKNPQTKNSCGWTAPSVEAINRIIEITETK